MFPHRCRVNGTHESGDEAVEQVAADNGLPDIDPDDFMLKQNIRAYGGIQIARKDVLHRLGYCRNSRRQHWVANRWKRTVSDVWFRRSLGVPGIPVDVPNVYRIRHTAKDRINPATKL